MSSLIVRHVEGDRFAIGIRTHLVTVDQPVADGGTDTAPTPTELFVAGLASCVAYYAHRYLARHGLPTAGLTVTGQFDLATRPARVDRVRLEITLPEGIEADRRAALLAVASHCTVHNSLEAPPEIVIDLAGTEAAA